ncbi:MAG: FkbM family methyltransferase [Bacteroidota bacterium]|jgi:FkbM family methyltransferase
MFNLKKYIRKTLSALMPKGKLKEAFKLRYYNFIFRGKFQFKALSDGTYKTYINQISVTSKQALYHIAPDFLYYNTFYNICPGDNVIDAGANFGHLSTYYSKLTGTAGRVYAFEPDSINRMFITENIGLNTDCPKNIILEDLLIWNTNSLIDFCESGTVGSSALYFNSTSKIIKKQSVTLDEWVFQQQIKRLNFIKMDIEGAEIQAMEGAVKVLTTLKPDLAIASYHIVDGKPTYIWLEKFFTEMNYPYKTVRFRHNEIITFAGPSIVSNSHEI